MSEKKFRAWDEDNKKMFWFSLKDLWAEGCEQQLAELDDPKRLALNTDFPYRNMDIMLYTGLKDKNGVEIYESDIITSQRQDNVEDKTTGMVYIEGGAFCLSRWKSLPLHALWLADDVFEIIGNRHENPELLEGG